MRLTYAAEQLISQVRESRPDAEVTEGEPDGFGVVREITFDKATSKWLWPLLEPNVDGRIAEAHYEARKGLRLVFQSRSQVADDRTPFELPAPPIEVPDTAVTEESGDEADEQGELPNP